MRNDVSFGGEAFQILPKDVSVHLTDTGQTAAFRYTQANHLHIFHEHCRCQIYTLHAKLILVGTCPFPSLPPHKRTQESFRVEDEALRPNLLGEI